MNFRKNFTAKIATKKDVANPTNKIEYSETVKEKSLFIISSIDAAKMVGTASKKENSTAVFLFVPRNNAGIIVAADLDTPGITEID